MSLKFTGLRGNFINREAFDNKDKTKTYYHATFLVGEDVAKCMFIKKADYDVLANVDRLGTVLLDLSFRKQTSEDSYILGLEKVALLPHPDNKK